MSGHFDDWLHRCGYCQGVRDEPCSQFVSATQAAAICENLRIASGISPDSPATAKPRLIQIGPLDV